MTVPYVLTFQIPSVHDDCQLECRLRLPASLRSAEHRHHSSFTIRGAIIAHPYAPLGGCYDDPVVTFMAMELLQAGCIVATFNFRGAGGSEGRTSWTGKPELGDYVAVYGFMLNYLHHLHTVLCVGPRSGSSEAVHLILGGYSFGSLIASHVPALDVMLNLFGTRGTETPQTAIHRIGDAARRIADECLQYLPPAKEYPIGPNDGTDQSQPQASTQISYLLVSPLLPPVSQLLTAFTALTVNVGGRASAKVLPAGRPTDRLSAHRTLALFGDQDTFTSARKLRRWVEDMSRISQSQFQDCEIDGAGHFWREPGAEARARHALQEWLQ
ncbi:Alpha/beta hydrolase fold-1 domain-containing protein [Penicillium ucsense]|uniref:Alpha/beta hydrolase fold-1 domain-containing protein n=1 Tax=Penicillium ucsense TaxID=2839758 RepID=A0A8J8WJ86_9EURO|nr:Alpha/beta hydrolase fold-1 domain-containing protein [Penicillium ucsense]KAF7735744.1 Alpha/beta hydrolase fold-1 domain-containing protein [Penicillium ucsense]